MAWAYSGTAKVCQKARNRATCRIMPPTVPYSSRKTVRGSGGTTVYVTCQVKRRIAQMHVTPVDHAGKRMIVADQVSISGSGQKPAAASV